MDQTPTQPDAVNRDATHSTKPFFLRHAGWGMALLLVVVAWAGAYALRAKPVHLEGWQPGLDAGMQVAEALDRPMLVMFTADWCGPCQQLKKEVIQTPGAEQAIAAGFVPVVVDIDEASSAAGVQRYGVQGIPMLILTDAQGEPIPGTVAYPNNVYPRTPAGFVDWLDSAEREASR